MKLWKLPVAAVLLAPLAGCVSKSSLREANQALELENFHLEQRLNDCCWKLQDAERDLAACRAAGTIPIYGGGLTPLAPAGSSTAPKRDPRRPAEADDVDKPPKIELPDDEPNMPSAGLRKEKAPRYNGPPVISPPNPNVPEGILPQPVSSRSPEGEFSGPPEAGNYRYPPDGAAAGPYPRNDPPQDEPGRPPEPPASQPPVWRDPNAAAPLEPTPQPEPEYVRPQEAPPARQPETVNAPMPNQYPSQPPAATPTPAPVVDRGPEPVVAPEPVREPTPAPVGRATPEPQPEHVAAPPGSVDAELRAQPDSRPLVEPEPVAAPYPSTAARPTSAPQRTPPRASANAQAGNAALSMMAINPKLTVWRQAPERSSPDDGLTIVVEPRTAAGEMVEVDGDMAIVVVDPTLQGDQSLVARWEYSPQKLAEHFRGTKNGGGFHFHPEWPTGRPTARKLDLYVRLTLPDRRQFVAEYSLEPSGAPQPLDAAPTNAPAPEPERAPNEPPPDPPISAPADGGVSRTAAWTTVDSRGAAGKSSRLGFVDRAGGAAAATASSASQWRRATKPLPPAPREAASDSTDSYRPAAGAQRSTGSAGQDPFGSATQGSPTSGSAWTPYR